MNVWMNEHKAEKLCISREKVQPKHRDAYTEDERFRHKTFWGPLKTDRIIIVKHFVPIMYFHMNANLYKIESR